MRVSAHGRDQSLQSAWVTREERALLKLGFGIKEGPVDVATNSRPRVLVGALLQELTGVSGNLGLKDPGTSSLRYQCKLHWPVDALITFKGVPEKKTAPNKGNVPECRLRFHDARSSQEPCSRVR